MLLFVDKLTNSDFSYLHHERGLLGETWLSHIELEGELDEQGMVCDFGIVKSTTRALLDDLIDHRLLVPAEAANLRLEDQGSNVRLHWALEDGQAIDHSSPRQCVTLIEAGHIDAETVARWCEQQLRQRLPGTIQSIRVRFTTEEIAGAHYQYSHGLKKHNGKCQRIAHGHRSKINILRNGEAAPDLEAEWAETLRDSYIATRADLSPDDDTPPGYYRFAYRAAEGEFSLQLPQRYVHLMDSDSTVEHIAAHIADTLKVREPQHAYTVRAYEGQGKGALVVR
ncbi:6-pyruvoyl trahydropterin synthase family protein [Gilvimarinus sp. F26214L]|uniref:6-pyruvoyl trahydropterin synthase family protein n=1 Tax=Gilvimarinus sp. DZF01 TaxID=3461371 RepID=UPI0040455F53